MNNCSQLAGSYHHHWIITPALCMSPKFKFQQLINEPFGPYPDDEILSPSFPPPGFLPTLEVLALECANEAIGFDECEHILAPSQNSLTARHPVFFYGLLKIESLGWLSENGTDLLEAELRHRDQLLHPHIERSGITLERLYGNFKGRGSTISVYIRCEKKMAAEYMTCEQLCISHILF
jgi:hypothetical protein